MLFVLCVVKLQLFFDIVFNTTRVSTEDLNDMMYFICTQISVYETDTIFFKYYISTTFFQWNVFKNNVSRGKKVFALRIKGKLRLNK